MKQRQIRRTYLALTDGIPPKKGTISAPIARMDDSVITREVNFEHGETAVTHYERLDVNNGYSLVELHLDTGRTHQIRVHMKYIGCPLPGDFLYHPVFDRISRQALHSFQLEFTHPITGKTYAFSGTCTGRFPECISFSLLKKSCHKLQAIHYDIKTAVLIQKFSLNRITAHSYILSLRKHLPNPRQLIFSDFFIYFSHRLQEVPSEEDPHPE